MQAYKIMARCQRTGVRLQQQDLTGHVITDLAEAQIVAQTFAHVQSQRLNETWTAEVSLYTVGHRPSFSDTDS